MRQLLGAGLHLNGRQVLAPTRLTLDKASGRIALLGANGAGKSMLLRLLAGVRVPTQGQVLGEAPHPARLGYVPQSPTLLARSIAANLRFMLRLSGWEKSARETRIAELLEWGGFSNQGGQPALQLSLGQQKRLAVLMALSARPPLLLLDEVTAHLDPEHAGRIEKLVLEHEGATLWVTHDLAQAKRVAQRVLFLHQGALVCDQSCSDFFAAPCHAAAEAYLQAQRI